jgi:predicted DNA-binding WGR domain protein
MSALERALRSGERFGVLSKAFVAGERFREFTLEPRRVGRLTVKSNRIAVVDPFGLGFGYKTLSRKVPRGRFPVEVAVAHYRKGPRKGEQRVALARIRLGKGTATGYRLADVPDQPERRWLGAKFGGYAVESGYGSFACGGAAKALDAACGAAFDEGELDHPQSRMLREQLTHPDAQARGWGSGELVPVMREGSLVAFSAGHGEGFYPSYWGYDDERRLVSLVTDFLVLPTDPELIRASWAGRTWRELHYDGDRGQRFWRVKVKGRVRTIEHGHVGKQGQSNEKQFTTSEAALEAAAKGIHRQLDAGYFELSSSASDLRHATKSGVAPKLRERALRTKRRAKPEAKILLETKTSASEVERKRAKRTSTTKSRKESAPQATASKRKRGHKPGPEKRSAAPKRAKPQVIEEKKKRAKPRADKKASSKKASSQKASSQKASSKKASSKKASSKKASSKKAPSQKASSKKAPSQKASSKKGPSKKGPSKKGPSKKAPSQKASSKKAPSKNKAEPKRSPSKKAPSKKAPAKNKAESKKGKATKKKPSARLAKLKAKAPAARPRRW